MFHLGYENQAELSSKNNKVTKVPNIVNNVDKIQIHSSLVDSSIVNGNAPSNVIWRIAPKTEPRTPLC